MEPPRPGWGSLKPPSATDVKGRSSNKGLAAPPSPLSHLVVLDFEWTADDRRKMEPCAEITQFPSVLVRLAGNTRLRVAQARPDRPRCGFNPTRPWRLRVWGEPASPTPEGYGLIAEQITLFVPAATAADARRQAGGVRITEASPLGTLTLQVALDGWNATYRIGWGQDLRFEHGQGEHACTGPEKWNGANGDDA